MSDVLPSNLFQSVSGHLGKPHRCRCESRHVAGRALRKRGGALVGELHLLDHTDTAGRLLAPWLQ